jgi:hypothetical protein
MKTKILQQKDSAWRWIRACLFDRRANTVFEERNRPAEIENNSEK